MKPQPNIFRYLSSMLLITCTLLFGCGDGSDYQEPSDTYSLVFLTGPFEGEKIILNEGNSTIGDYLNQNDITSEDQELLEALKTLEITMDNGKVTLTPEDNDDYELFINDEEITFAIELLDGDLIDFLEKENDSPSVERANSNFAPTTMTFSVSNTANNRFYVIAHMANTERAVDWSYNQGANAVEIDLNFDDNGNPTEFTHGAPCDCSCLVRPPMCSVLGDCLAKSSRTSLLEHIATTNRLALVVIDSKIGKKDSANKQIAAGKNVFKLLENHLFKKGYSGQVIIGAPYLTCLPYLKSAAEKANSSPYKSKIYFSIDMEGNNAYMTIDKLIQLPTDNRVYGTGISACAPGTYYDGIKQAVKQKDVGTIGGLVYIWTLDKESSMEKYLDLGVNGIMTNDPGKLYELAKKRGLILAGINTPITPAKNNKLFNYLNTCDCEYHKGGCTLSTPAPRYKTCKCKYKGGWTCGGELVHACNRTSPYCVNPDLEAHTCVLGNGDCGGYPEAKCDCKYLRRPWLAPSGCYISKPPPPDVACECKYKGGWTCGGDITSCSDPTSPYCEHPDYSRATCLQGRGDCKGY